MPAQRACVTVSEDYMTVQRARVTTQRAREPVQRACEPVQRARVTVQRKRMPPGKDHGTTEQAPMPVPREIFPVQLPYSTCSRERLLVKRERSPFERELHPASASAKLLGLRFEPSRPFDGPLGNAFPFLDFILEPLVLIRQCEWINEKKPGHQVANLGGFVAPLPRPPIESARGHPRLPPRRPR